MGGREEGADVVGHDADARAGGHVHRRPQAARQGQGLGARYQSCELSQWAVAKRARTSSGTMRMRVPVVMSIGAHRLRARARVRLSFLRFICVRRSKYPSTSSPTQVWVTTTSPSRAECR